MFMEIHIFGGGEILKISWICNVGHAFKEQTDNEVKLSLCCFSKGLGRKKCLLLCELKVGNILGKGMGGGGGGGGGSGR